MSFSIRNTNDMQSPSFASYAKNASAEAAYKSSTQLPSQMKTEKLDSLVPTTSPSINNISNENKNIKTDDQAKPQGAEASSTKIQEAMNRIQDISNSGPSLNKIYNASLQSNQGAGDSLVNLKA